MFMFATTEPQRIPITILSRCQRHDFRRIHAGSITQQMEMICARENFSISAEGLGLIAREADGSMRDALSLLDQVMACAEKEATDAQVLEVLGVVDRKVIFDMSKAVFEQDMPQILEVLDDVYQRGHDIKKVYGELLAHFRNMMIVKMGQRIDRLVDLPAHEIDQIRGQVKAVAPELIQQWFDLLFGQEAAIRFAVQPKLALEMAFVKMMQVKPALPIDVLIEKLDALRKDISASPSGQTDGDLSFSSAQKKNPNVPHRPAASVSKKIDLSAADLDLEKVWQDIFKRLSDPPPHGHVSDQLLPEKDFGPASGTDR